MSEKRKSKRFDINFKIFSNEVEGKGINISKYGFGFLSTDEIIPADEIPFTAKISKIKNNKKIYLIKGIGRLLFSIPDLIHNKFYYNGIEFIKLDQKSLKVLSEILNIEDK